MSKAILIMDMPEMCCECPCEADMVCQALHEELDDSCKKLNDCPLREVPQKKDTKYHPCRNPYEVSGYNACIDDIGGGE